MRKFWNWMQAPVKDLETQVQEQEAERTLFINGPIADSPWFDDDVTPQLFKDELEAGSGDITVWINSYGGDCVAAAQIYNMLLNYKGAVTVKIDGIAASAASVIAMAGTKVYVSPISLIMVHNPSTVACGDAAELQKTIAMLGAVKESIINAYAAKTGLRRKTLSDMMDKETFLQANDALRLGFADAMMERSSLDDAQLSQLADDITKLKARCGGQKELPDDCWIESEKNVKPKFTADSALERLDLIKNWR